MKNEEIKIYVRSYNLSEEENALANDCLNDLLSYLETVGEQKRAEKFIELFYRLCSERNFDPNQLLLDFNKTPPTKTTRP